MQTKPNNRTKTNLAVDGAIFVAFLVAAAPRFTGISVHEWLGLASGAAVITHLLLHWEWIVAITRRFLGRTSWRARFNYMLNALLFTDLTAIVFTGIMISRVALPALGIHFSDGETWRRLHALAADGMVLLIGLHIAVHWQWIVNAVKRYVVSPLRSRPARDRRNPAHTPVAQEA